MVTTDASLVGGILNIQHLSALPAYWKSLPGMCLIPAIKPSIYVEFLTSGVQESRDTMIETDQRETAAKLHDSVQDGKLDPGEVCYSQPFHLHPHLLPYLLDLGHKDFEDSKWRNPGSNPWWRSSSMGKSQARGLSLRKLLLTELLSKLEFSPVNQGTNQIFSTTAGNHSFVAIQVFEGVSPMTKDSLQLRKFDIAAAALVLPEALTPIQPLWVDFVNEDLPTTVTLSTNQGTDQIFETDANGTGILTVSEEDKSTGSKVLEKMIYDDKKMTDEVTAMKGKFEARNEIVNPAYIQENQLSDKEKLGGKLAHSEQKDATPADAPPAGQPVDVNTDQDQDVSGLTGALPADQPPNAVMLDLLLYVPRYVLAFPPASLSTKFCSTCCSSWAFKSTASSSNS